MIKIGKRKMSWLELLRQWHQTGGEIYVFKSSLELEIYTPKNDGWVKSHEEEGKGYIEDGYISSEELAKELQEEVVKEGTVRVWFDYGDFFPVGWTGEMVYISRRRCIISFLRIRD